MEMAPETPRLTIALVFWTLHLGVYGSQRLAKRIAPLAQSHLPYRGPVAAAVDGVHDRQRTTYAEGEPEEETDQRA